MADTTTLGFMTPAEEPTADRPLEDIFQEALRGITGLAGQFVRPQAPATISNQPEVTVDWISFRVVSTGHDFDAHLEHQSALLTNGGSIQTRDEMVDLVASFYGPNAHLYLNRWITGLAVDQNRWTLMDHGIKFREQGKPVNLPALVKENWQRRLDLTTTFARRIKVTLPIRSIADAEFGLNNEHYITPIVVQPPTS